MPHTALATYTHHFVVVGYRYAWVPFMECYHSVVSMTHAVVGSVRFGAGPEAETFNINAGRGYIEKDWGRDFPETYVWMQGNSFDSDPEVWPLHAACSMQRGACVCVCVRVCVCVCVCVRVRVCVCHP